MNEIALNPIATAINLEHSNALKHADCAISHAKRAGELLLEAKKHLPHGQFAEWILANVTVSPRQAQRYMAAALGKPTPIRAITQKAKNDTVSYLPTQAVVYSDGFVSFGVADIAAHLNQRIDILKAENEALKTRCDSYRSEGEEMRNQFERNRRWIAKLQEAA